VLDQQTSVQNSVLTTTRSWSNGGMSTTQDTFSFPIIVNVIYPVNSAEFGLTVSTAQNYQTSKQVWFGGFPLYFNWVTNSVKATDVSPAASSQQYTSFDSEGGFYDCQIASQKNTLTSVSRGCNPY